MKTIQLTQGLVDDENYACLSQFKWHLHHGYAARAEDGKIILMHRVLLHATPGTLTDHKDCDKLNNKKANLRICNRLQNQINQPKRKGCKSKFKGVSISVVGKYKYYSSEIKVGLTRHRKTFPFTPMGERQAALHYNIIAKKYFRDFANLNIL